MPVSRRDRRRALVCACAALGMLVASGCSSSSSSQPDTSADTAAASSAGPDAGATITKRRLGPGVNTLSAEQLPIADASGDTLYFTRATTDGPTQVYVSHRMPDGTWSDAERLPVPLNDETPANAGAVSITSALPDGRTVLLLGDFLSSGERTDGCADSSAAIGAGDMECLPLAVARDTGRGWTRDAPIRTEPYKNRLDVSGGALAPDGRTIVFAARDRNGTVGNHNRLFLTRWNEATDVWASPREIPGLAGAFEALAPFIGPDGRSLYFSSNRTDGQGGFDLYVTRRLDETWLAWTQPVNLGPDVNTAANDVSISVDARHRAFVASDAEGQLDIYECNLPARPD